jgi:hypothetical protein
MTVFRRTNNLKAARSLLIRRGFGCLALGVAQRSLLLLSSLLFLGACACCPLSLALPRRDRSDGLVARPSSSPDTTTGMRGLVRCRTEPERLSHCSTGSGESFSGAA